MATLRRGNYSSHAMQKAMLEQSRRREEHREDTLRSLAREKMELANLMSDDLVEKRRHLRIGQMEQKEHEMLEAIEKAERDRNIKAEQLAQEEAIALELERHKLETLRDEKMRQQIRETSLELRELEAQLKAAYMNKERAAQIAEKEAKKYDDMEREAEIAKCMKSEHERAEDSAKKREEEIYQSNVRYQQELERQLEEQESKKQTAYEEFLKEKLMIDTIVRKIYEEDQREREREMVKQQMTQQFIEEFKQQREEWKILEEKKMADENEQIRRFAELQGKREVARQEEKKKMDEFRAKVQDELAEKIADKRRREEEMEQVRQDLYLEEREETERQREFDEMKRRIRMRLELKRQEQEQLSYKHARRAAEEQEEEEFRQQMLAKFAEDDRIEQMNAQKRRMKQLEHKRAVERLLEDRRAQFLKERESELTERHAEEDMERFRQGIIEEERQRLLRQHATKLLGYLPKGVIRDDKDLDLLGVEFKDTYRKTQVDPFDEPSWEGQ